MVSEFQKFSNYLLHGKYTVLTSSGDGPATDESLAGGKRNTEGAMESEARQGAVCLGRVSSLQKMK